MSELRAYHYCMAALDMLVKLNPARDSTAGLLLDGLAHALNDYEQMKYPIRPPTPEEAAAFRAEQEGRGDKR